MKKRKKVFILIFILCIIIICALSFAVIYKDNTTIEVPEISLLQQEFEIESSYYRVILDNSENQNSNSSNSEGSFSTSSSGTSSGSKTKKSSGSGSNTRVGAVTYTPKIQIPRTGIKYTIYSQMTVKNMEKGVVILSTDRGLNEPGNTVISGHNRRNGKLFSRNMRIQAGDIIYITDSSGRKIAYSVYSKFLTGPNDASYVERDTGGKREISLTTCTDDSSQRLIILASET